MKKKYSYYCLLKYSFKLLNKDSQNNHFLKSTESNFKKDIISICSSSPEEFWNNFNCKNINFLKYRSICKKIEKYVLNKKPVPYINKNCFFYNISLELEEGIFIPQSDTEILVESALHLINKIWGDFEKLKILEIGTGSGNISISLSKNRKFLKIIATDINKKALDFAKKNSLTLGIKNIKFLFSNVFSKVRGLFDIIISNPPYIAIDDYILLSSFAKKQPRNALLAKRNGYWFYHEIIKNSKLYLGKKFLMIFEIGSNQMNEIIKILLSYFAYARVETFKDFSGNDRVIAVYQI